MDLRLEGKIALVVAASKGIGKGVAKILANEGCQVIISSSNMENLRIAAEEIGVVDIEVINLTDRDSVKTGIAKILKRHPRIDILVTNSPGPPSTGVLEPSLEMLDRALDANLISFMLLTQACVKPMKENGFGRLIHLTSMTGREPDPGMVLSNITRAGVLAYSKTLARELGPVGITSNAILTGGVMTDRVYELFNEEARNTGQSVESLLQQARETTPVGFIPDPEEFAQMIAFIASPLSAYLNGVNLPLDGGMMKAL